MYTNEILKEKLEKIQICIKLFERINQIIISLKKVKFSNNYFENLIYEDKIVKKLENEYGEFEGGGLLAGIFEESWGNTKSKVDKTNQYFLGWWNGQDFLSNEILES